MVRLSTLPVLVLAVTLPLLAACGDDAEAGDPPVIDVQDTGGEPRRLLAIDVAEGYRETAMVTVDQSVDAGGQSADSPPFTITLVSEVTSVSDDEIEVEQTYEAIDVDPAADPATTSRIETAVQPLVGLTGTSVLAPSGQILRTDFEAPAELESSMRQTFDQLTEQGAALSVSFPDEELGAGARWTATAQLGLGGVEIEQTTTYTLDAIDGDAYEISVEIDQEYEEGDADGFEVTGGSGSGSGSLSGNLGNLTAAGSVDAQNSIDAEADGQSQTVSTTTSTTSKVTAG